MRGGGSDQPVRRGEDPSISVAPGATRPNTLSPSANEANGEGTAFAVRRRTRTTAAGRTDSGGDAREPVVGPPSEREPRLLGQQP